jgi:YHS domain-containing protein
MKQFIQILFFNALIYLLAACTTLSEKIYIENGAAIEGYDPVSYFTQHNAVKGKPNITYLYKKANWHFSSVENKKLFISNPNKYIPQYGGYCAYAMTFGWVVSSDPEAWNVYHDKLYLNYNQGVREDWNENKDEYIKEANTEWANKNTLHR